MHYQISRDGQTYGPYTLEDLKRYVASGNILLSDLAKSEAMADWVPVEQVLSQVVPEPAAPPAAEYQPVAGAVPNTTPYTGLDYGTPVYANPTVALATSPYPDAPNLHWGLVLLFAFFTCGLFMFIWNLVIASWLKRVQPNATSLYYYVAAAVLLVIQTIASIPTTIFQMSHHGELHATNFLGVFLGLATWIVRLIARYSQRASLEEHFNGPEPAGLQLDPFMTFFFGGLYFQAKLNGINEMKQRARFSAQRPY